MNWNQIKLVCTREYLTQVKNKTFLILTFATPLIIIGLGLLIGFLTQVNKETKNVAVVDESGLFGTALTSSEQLTYSFYAGSEAKSIQDSLEDSETLTALLVIPKSANYDSIEKNSKLYTKGSSGIEFKRNIENNLEDVIRDLKMKSEGISEEKLEQIKSNFDLNVFNIKKISEDGDDSAAKDSKENDLIKLVVAGGLTYIIFMFMMVYGVKVMRSVTEEKSSRVVEIIISSVKPFNLMMGKIVAVTLVALTQFLIWVVLIGVLGTVIYGVLGVESASSEQLEQAKLLSDNPEFADKIANIMQTLTDMNLPLIVVCFVLYFILGYLFYSSIFAAIGSAVENDADTQQFTFLPMFPLMIGIYGSFFAIINNPEGPVAWWLSMIPLTSPISMITRLPYEVPLWEIALSLLLLAGSTILMVKFAAKIYRIGILMYGKKASFKELWKWLRYSE